MKIPITKPYYGDEEKQAVLKPLETGWLVQGPNVKEFEGAVSNYTGAAYARATTSCTTALHLSLAVLGVGPGDEVILPSFTFVATATAALFLGALPVFADIDPETLCLSPESVKRNLTENTKAVIPVHWGGTMADLDALEAICEEHGLDYVVLKRLPKEGLTRRSSTDLRGF